MKSTINKLTAHNNDYFEISSNSRYIQKYLASTKRYSSDNYPNIYSYSLTTKYIENTRKKYRKNSSLKHVNMVVINLMHDEIPGSDIGMFISSPVKEINPYTLINGVHAAVTRGNANYEITIDDFWLASMAYVIDDFKDSEMQFVLTNQGLIITIMDDSDLANCILSKNNGKIQIIIYYKQDEISIDDSSFDPYRKIPISVNNSKNISQFFSSYWRYENLEIAKYFIKKYQNSCIYDFVNDNHLINLSNIKCFSDSGSTELQISKTITIKSIHYDDISGKTNEKHI